jgi:hypothetical protein
MQDQRRMRARLLRVDFLSLRSYDHCVRIQIGTGYYGLTTLPKPAGGSTRLSEGFRQAFATPVEALPEVVLSNPPQPAREPAARQPNETSTEK